MPDMQELGVEYRELMGIAATAQTAAEAFAMTGARRFGFVVQESSDLYRLIEVLDDALVATEKAVGQGAETLRSFATHVRAAALLFAEVDAAGAGTQLLGEKEQAGAFPYIIGDAVTIQVAGGEG